MVTEAGGETASGSLEAMGTLVHHGSLAAMMSHGYVVAI